MIQRLLVICGLMILATFPYGAASDALAQIGDPRAQVTWAELIFAISLMVGACTLVVLVLLWILKKISDTKSDLHKRMDSAISERNLQVQAVTEQLNNRFLSVVEQFSGQQRLAESRMHAIELLLAQRYVTKDDLNTVKNELLSAIEKTGSETRADVRVIHQRLNAAAIPNTT
jgi:hypothetical protein